MNAKHGTHRAAGLAAILLLTLATTALAGPPWLSIELPANPYDRVTRGAIALVRTYHHGGPIQLQVQATAEGLVEGERVSLPLELVATSATGLYALRGALPERGAWVLVIRGGAEGNLVTAIVEVGPDGGLRAVDVPTRGMDPPIPRAVTAQDIDARLRALASASDSGSGMGLAALGLAGIGLWRISRKN